MVGTLELDKYGIYKEQFQSAGLSFNYGKKTSLKKLEKIYFDQTGNKMLSTIELTPKNKRATEQDIIDLQETIAEKISKNEMMLKKSDINANKEFIKVQNKNLHG